MARTLAMSVTVTRDDTGERETFLAGTSPPKWAADKITSKSAWAGDGGEHEQQSQPSGAQPQAETPPRSSARSRRSRETEEGQ